MTRKQVKTLLLQARNVRNNLMHNANYALDDSTLQEMTIHLVALLQDAKELAKRPKTLEALNRITEVGYASPNVISNSVYSSHP